MTPRKGPSCGLSRLASDMELNLRYVGALADSSMAAASHMGEDRLSPVASSMRS